MKATCKLCGAVIKTDPDTVFNADRDQRILKAFWNRVAFHIAPVNGRCTANNQKLVQARFAMTMQDNGWFQRWRLLACVTTEEPELLAKKEDWREYLHTITSIEASRAPDSTEPEPGSAKLN